MLESENPAGGGQSERHDTDTARLALELYGPCPSAL